MITIVLQMFLLVLVKYCGFSCGYTSVLVLFLIETFDHILFV